MRKWIPPAADTAVATVSAERAAQDKMNDREKFLLDLRGCEPHCAAAAFPWMEWGGEVGWDGG